MINDLAKEVHQNARNKGFFDSEKNIGEMLCLIHSEVSETLEADRKSRFADLHSFIGFENRGITKDYDTYLKEDAIPSFDKNIKDTFEDELADIMIRVMDLATFKGVDLEKHIELKMKRNSLREHKHGKKY